MSSVNTNANAVTPAPNSDTSTSSANNVREDDDEDVKLIEDEEMDTSRNGSTAGVAGGSPGATLEGGSGSAVLGLTLPKQGNATATTPASKKKGGRKTRSKASTKKGAASEAPATNGAKTSGKKGRVSKQQAASSSNSNHGSPSYSTPNGAAIAAVMPVVNGVSKAIKGAAGAKNKHKATQDEVHEEEQMEEYSSEELPPIIDEDDDEEMMEDAEDEDEESDDKKKKKHKPKFTAEDDDLLVDLKEQKKLSWKQIAEYFHGRTAGALQVRYCTKLKMRSGVWTDEDVITLHKAMKEYEEEKWVVVAQKMGSKYTASLCRDKYHEVMNLPAPQKHVLAKVLPQHEQHVINLQRKAAAKLQQRQSQHLEEEQGMAPHSQQSHDSTLR